MRTQRVNRNRMLLGSISTGVSSFPGRPERLEHTKAGLRLPRRSAAVLFSSVDLEKISLGLSASRQTRRQCRRLDDPGLIVPPNRDFAARWNATGDQR